MATIDLTGTWQQEVTRITNQFIPGQSYAPEAVVPKSTIDVAAIGGENIGQLSKPPAGLKAPVVPSAE